MSFEERLEKAIQRGQQRGDNRARQAKAQALSEEECKGLHSEYQLKLSEHIEACMGRLPNHFPGFQYETVYGERGWGAACRRDDLVPQEGGRRANYYSRLEMTVRPFSSARVLELTAKGTIRNKEVFSRSHFQRLHEVDLDSFLNLVDMWILEYAEMFAATG